MIRKTMKALALAAVATATLGSAAEAQYYGQPYGGYYGQSDAGWGRSGYGRGYDRRGDYDGYANYGYGRRGYANYGYGRRGYDNYGYGYGRGNRGRGYRCDRGTGGTVIGAIAGGLLGNEVAGRGDRTTGAIVGAGVGALAGRAIDRNC